MCKKPHFKGVNNNDLLFCNDVFGLLNIDKYIKIKHSTTSHNFMGETIEQRNRSVEM